MGHATVHVGQNGGVQYRLWTGPDTFRVVSRYQAKAHLTPEEAVKADAMESANRTAKAQQSADAQSWREIRRGG